MDGCFLTLNESGKISIHFADFEQVKKISSHFADFDQIKKIRSHFALQLHSECKYRAKKRKKAGIGLVTRSVI